MVLPVAWIAAGCNIPEKLHEIHPAPLQRHVFSCSQPRHIEQLVDQCCHASGSPFNTLRCLENDRLVEGSSESLTA
jgi:hypothetical protein